MTSYSIGLDLGTTNIKACALSDNGEILFQASQPSVVNPVESGAEMNPRHFLCDLENFLRGVLSQIRVISTAQLSCISITGMAEAGCLIDGEGQTQSQILLWYDKRGEVEAEELRVRHQDEILRTCGIRLSNVPTIYKLAYLRKHRSLSGLRWCGVPELAAMYLSGEWFTDLTLATRTGGFDIRQLCYSERVLSLAGLDVSVFPPACTAFQQNYQVSSHIAKAFDISENVRVVVAGHDDIVAAYGAGLHVGALADSAGTAEGLETLMTELPPLDEVARSQMATAPYYLKDTWVIIGGVGTTGNLFAQLKQRFGLSYAEIDELAAQKAAYPEGAVEAEITTRKFTDIRFLPQLTAVQAANAVYDLLMRAFSARAEKLQCFCQSPSGLICFGGGASAAELCARKAQVLGDIPCKRLCDLEAAAYGAALIGNKKSVDVF